MKIYNKQQQQQQKEEKTVHQLFFFFFCFLLSNLSLMLPYPISYPWITGDE